MIICDIITETISDPVIDLGYTSLSEKFGSTIALEIIEDFYAKSNEDLFETNSPEFQQAIAEIDDTTPIIGNRYYVISLLATNNTVRSTEVFYGKVDKVVEQTTHIDIYMSNGTEKKRFPDNWSGLMLARTLFYTSREDFVLARLQLKLEFGVDLDSITETFLINSQEFLHNDYS